jgi:hypothetical protein
VDEFAVRAPLVALENARISSEGLMRSPAPLNGVAPLTLHTLNSPGGCHSRQSLPSG